MATIGLRKLMATTLWEGSSLRMMTISKVRSVHESLASRQHGRESGPTVLFDHKRAWQSTSFRMYSVKGTVWDDSDWMKHGDSNAEAYEKLDITKLRPFPEFRNVATGPVWGPNAFERVWKTYYESQAPTHLTKQQNEEWKQFVEDFGFSPVEYFVTSDYKKRYAERLIWADFRRNHKGSIPPQRTRQYCLRFGPTGNPCPLCRDEKILINFKNISLLRHFIDAQSGEIFSTIRTGVCRKKQSLLKHTVWLARDQGLLPTPVNTTPNHDIDHYGCDHLAVRPN